MEVIKINMSLWGSYVALLIVISFLTNTESKSPKKKSPFPKDEKMLGKQGPKVLEARLAFVKDSVKVGAEGWMTTRPQSSPVTGLIWSPNRTETGKWGDWTACPEGFVSKLQVSYAFSQDAGKDSPGIHKITMVCINFLDGSTGQLIEIGDHRDPKASPTSQLEHLNCETRVVTQMAVKNQLDMGCQDDLGLVNVKLFCANPEKTEEQLFKSPFVQSVGIWSKPLRCPAYSGLCGMRVQTQNEQKTDLCDDAIGIGSVGFACCLVEDPAYSCLPQASWITRTDVVGYVNNKCQLENEDGTAVLCRFSLTHGVLYSKKANVQLTQTYESIGYPKSAEISSLQANFIGSLDPNLVLPYNFTEIFRALPLHPTTNNVFVNDCDGAIQELILECPLPNKEELYVIHSGIWRCK